MMRQESRDSAVIGGGGTLACYLAGVGSKSVPLAKETQATGAGGWVWASCVVLRPCPSAPPAHGRWAEACHPVPPRQEVSPELQPSSVCRWGIAHTHHHEEPGPVQWAE